MEKNAEITGYSGWLTRDKRTLVKASILILSVSLWMSVLYWSLISDPTASILSFCAVSSTVLMMNNEFCKVRRIDVIIIKVLDFLWKLLIIFGGIAIYANIWNSAFYSLFSGMFIKRMIFKMRQSRANCVHLNFNLERSSDHTRGIKADEVGKDESNADDLVLNDNIENKQYSTSLKYNEELNSADESTACHAIRKNNLILNTNDVEIENEIENSPLEIVKTLSNIPETPNKFSDDLDVAEDCAVIRTVTQDFKKEFLLGRHQGDKLKLHTRTSIECKGTEETKQLMQHQLCKSSQSSEILKFEDISEDRRLWISKDKVKHGENNLDESVVLDAINVLKRNENFTSSDILEQSELLNANEGEVHLNFHNEDNEFFKWMKDIINKVTWLDVKDTGLDPNNTNEQARKDLNFVDNINQTPLEKFPFNNEEMCEKGNEMVNSSHDTEAVRVQLIDLLFLVERYNKLKNATLSYQRENVRVAQNQGDGCMSEQVMNADHGSLQNQTLKLEDKYSSKTDCLPEQCPSENEPEINFNEMLGSTELCCSAISGDDQDSYEDRLQKNLPSIMKTDLDERSIIEANEAKTEASMEEKNVGTILNFDSTVDNVVNRIDLSFIYAVG